MRTHALRVSSRQRMGFTLIEIMVVLVIVAILAAIALPSYNRQVQKSRRTDAQNVLMRIAAAQERNYTLFNRYAATLTGAPPAGLGLADASSEHDYYTVTLVVGAGNQTFTLTAAPQDAQVDDTCGSLTLGNSDAKGFSGNEDNGVCW
jgi:type IV pilus assembly protein PilE